MIKKHFDLQRVENLIKMMYAIRIKYFRAILKKSCQKIVLLTFYFTLLKLIQEIVNTK